MEETEEMEDLLFYFSERGFKGRGAELQQVFRPLDNFEYAIATHRKSKARIKRGWLRLYAIRLAGNCYVVTGGAIKLTLEMKRDHLKDELKKLEQVKQYPRINGIDYPEDLNSYKDE